MTIRRRIQLAAIAGVAVLSFVAQPAAAKDIKIGMVNLSLCLSLIHI